MSLTLFRGAVAMLAALACAFAVRRKRYDYAAYLALMSIYFSATAVAA